MVDRSWFMAVFRPPAGLWVTGLEAST